MLAFSFLKKKKREKKVLKKLTVYPKYSNTYIHNTNLMSSILPTKALNDNVTSAINNENNFTGQILMCRLEDAIFVCIYCNAQFNHLIKISCPMVPLSPSLLAINFWDSKLRSSLTSTEKVTNITRNDPPNFPFIPFRYFWELNCISTSQICLCFFWLSSFSETSKQLPLDLLFIFRSKVPFTS